jgi:hypothetical protein
MKIVNEIQDSIYYYYFKVGEYNKIYHSIYTYNYFEDYSLLGFSVM